MRQKFAIPFSVAIICFLASLTAAADDFVAGADFSLLKVFEDRGSEVNLPGANWTTMTNSVQTSGSVFHVTVPLDGSSATFFRLQSN